MIGYDFLIRDDYVWRLNQGSLVPLSPPDLMPSMVRSYRDSLLRESGAWLLRYESAFDLDVESSWWHVIKDKTDTMESLPKKTRYAIRKAQKSFDAMAIDRGVIVEKGYSVYQSAYQRYETHEPIFNEDSFKQAVRALPEETEFWGIFDKLTGELVAFAENYINSETCFFVTMWISPSSMNRFSGYLLFFAMEQFYLGKMGLRYISDGARSISHMTNVHDFLIKKFKYRKAYAYLHIEYVAWFGWIVRVFYPFRSIIERSSKPFLRKVAIVLRQESLRRASIEIERVNDPRNV